MDGETSVCGVLVEAGVASLPGTCGACPWAKSGQGPHLQGAEGASDDLWMLGLYSALQFTITIITNSDRAELEAE